MKFAELNEDRRLKILRQFTAEYQCQVDDQRKSDAFFRVHGNKLIQDHERLRVVNAVVALWFNQMPPAEQTARLVAKGIYLPDELTCA
jgi:hypothetical protein